MSDLSEIDSLKAPISEDRPCGEDLEDTQLLASFDAYRLFGQILPPSQAPDWRAIKSKSLSALKSSKDIRLLVHLAASELRISGLSAFFQIIEITAYWIDQYWDQVYPQIGDDIVFRRNALNSFADRVAILDGVRRSPLASNRQIGSITLRDTEIVAGQAPTNETDSKPPDQALITAVFSSVQADELQTLHEGVRGAISALKLIESRMRDVGGSEAAPAFDSLLSQLVSIQHIVEEHLPDSADQSGGDKAEMNSGHAGELVGTIAVGSIRTRQDAIKALDAVSNYFRQNEPSSPIPIFLDRAKRLVSKGFMELLADIAPDAVGQAKIAGGIRDDE